MRWFVAIGIATACSGGAERPAERGPAPPAPTAQLFAVHDAATAPEPAQGRILSEIEARSLLAERFRSAGFRVLYDVRVGADGFELTVDGWDPDREVGFEYIDDAERGTDLEVAERSALIASKKPILIIDATSEARVSAAADEFLRAIADAGSGR